MTKLRDALTGVEMFHVFFLLVLVVPQAAMAAACHHKWLIPIPAAAVAVWLWIPCKDRVFGNRGRHYWLRQTALIVGTIIVVIVGLTP